MSQIMTSLFLSTVSLVVCGFAALFVLRLTRCRSPFCHRLVWCVVVGQGVLWFVPAVDIPLLAPEPPVVSQSPRVSVETVETNALTTPTVSALLEPNPVSMLHEPIAEVVEPLLKYDYNSQEQQPGTKRNGVIGEGVIETQAREFRGDGLQQSDGDPGEAAPPWMGRRIFDKGLVLAFVAWLCGMASLFTLQIACCLRTLSRLRNAKEASPEQAVEWQSLLFEFGIDPEKLPLGRSRPDDPPGNPAARTFALSASRPAQIVPFAGGCDAALVQPDVAFRHAAFRRGRRMALRRRGLRA